jgi:hypothetical protein
MTASAGCSRRAPELAPARPAPAAAQPPAPMPVSKVLVLESGGTPPSDTTVTLTTGAQRTVIVRNGPPDNTVFVEVTFPPNAFGPDSGAAVKARIHPRPGVYGIDLDAERPIAGGARVTFKYARYFAAPAAARARYGSDPAYERALWIGRLAQDGTVTFLPSSRPAADNLEAFVPGAGSYIVGAPE